MVGRKRGGKQQLKDGKNNRKKRGEIKAYLDPKSEPEKQHFHTQRWERKRRKEGKNIYGPSETFR